MCGVDPGPLTLRELMWMARGRRRDAWERTALAAAIAASAAGVKRVTPADFMPAELRPPRPRQRSARVADLIRVFCKDANRHDRQE